MCRWLNTTTYCLTRFQKSYISFNWFVFARAPKVIQESRCIATRVELQKHADGRRRFAVKPR